MIRTHTQRLCPCPPCSDAVGARRHLHVRRQPAADEASALHGKTRPRALFLGHRNQPQNIKSADKKLYFGEQVRLLLPFEQKTLDIFIPNHWKFIINILLPLYTPQGYAGTAKLQNLFKMNMKAVSRDATLFIGAHLGSFISGGTKATWYFWDRLGVVCRNKSRFGTERDACQPLARYLKHWGCLDNGHQSLNASRESL